MLEFLPSIRGRRGDISVTVFVILVIAVMVFSLLSFSLSSISVFNKIAEGYRAVEEFNVAVKAAEFESRDVSGIVVNRTRGSGFNIGAGYGGWYSSSTKKVLDVEVRVNRVP